MARAMVQMDEQVKLDLDAFKDKQYYCKTASDSVEYLLKYYYENELKKATDREEAKKEDDIRRKTAIHLGEDLKLIYMEFTAELGLRSESSAIQFLLDHYTNSDQISKATFGFLRTLK